jgi:hemolysin III
MPTTPAAASPAAVLATAVAELKPRLRGWLHAYAAIISIVTGTVLVAVVGSVRTAGTTATMAIYAATVTLLFGTSALYHRVTWSPRAHGVMRRLDHSMIFIFIAGTYTPIAVVTLSRAHAVLILSVVWAGALCGVVLQSAWPTAPRWLSVPCYLAVGWVAVFVMPQVLHHAGIAALTLIVAGGLLYSVGALMYALKRPNPWPNVFGFHEAFHTCTLLGAICHYVAIWLAVFG